MSDTNPFAPKPVAAAAANDTPFDDGDDLGIEIPPAPVGVLRGYIKEVKKYPDKKNPSKTNYMVVVHCDDPVYAASEDATIWVPYAEANNLRTIAAALGLTCEVSGTRVLFVDNDGNRGLAAFKNKPGLFVYCPNQGKPSLARFGLPKPKYSPEWDQYAEEAQFSDDQLKALKRSAHGIVPADVHDKF